MKNQKRNEKFNLLLTSLITSYLGEIHMTLLQIMKSVNTKNMESHNSGIEELQKTQKDIIELLKKYG